jgi:hypothetical protein
MNSLAMVTLGSLLLILLFRWGFQNLPQAQWQVFAVLPIEQRADGSWRGVNFTYYGVFMALAHLVATGAVLGLLQAIQLPPLLSLVLVGTVVLVSLPFARLIARLVEKRNNTFTTAGAAAVGTILLPGIIALLNWIGPQAAFPPIPLLPAFAAFSIAYALGEGLGRLSCISFGCCYGKPILQCPRWVQWLFRNCCFVFTGNTKKAAYESGLEGIPLVPIQAMTTVFLVLLSLAGTIWFSRGWFWVTLVGVQGGIQGWRIFSETLRHDFRGGGKVSAYQILAGLSLVYSLACSWLAPSPVPEQVDLVLGLKALWNPATLLFLQSVSLVVFLFMGRSTVTASSLDIHLSWPALQNLPPEYETQRRATTRPDLGFKTKQFPEVG